MPSVSLTKEIELLKARLNAVEQHMTLYGKKLVTFGTIVGDIDRRNREFMRLINKGSRSD